MVFGPFPRFERVTDGTSNTIAFAEHYSYGCGGTAYFWMVGNVALNYPSPIADGIRRLRAATFADQKQGDVYPITSTDPAISRGSVPGVTFQSRPTIADCDPRLAQTLYPDGMVVAMLDGSVRTIEKGISEAVYWGAVTPRGGEAFGEW
jgi:hypothetical protein